MDLIILQGPPASGKLTIGTELSVQLNYPLLHNHLTVNLAQNIFAFQTPEYTELRDLLRKTVIDFANKKSLSGLIFTQAVSSEREVKFLEELAEMSCSEQGVVLFVRLHADQGTLLQRVNSSGRAEMKKLVDPVILRERLKAVEYTTTTSLYPRIDLDTSTLGVNKCVARIVEEIEQCRRAVETNKEY